MTKDEIVELFYKKGVVSSTRKRKNCWKTRFDEECSEVFQQFSKDYRSEEEAWFCLLKNVEPYKCEICGNLAFFTGSTRREPLGYRTTCDLHSPNQSPAKLKKFAETIDSRTDERRHEISEKRKATNKKLYGDENYNLYGSESFRARLLAKYGNSFYNNREKAKQTCLDRYGVSTNLKTEGFQDLAIAKKREIYGNASNYEKTKLTNLKKYGSEHIGQVKCFQEASKLKKTDRILQIEKEHNCTSESKLFSRYGQGWRVLDLQKLRIGKNVFISNEDIPKIEEYINTPHQQDKVSQGERDLFGYISSIYSGNVQRNINSLVPNGNHRYFELDLYLQAIKLAFEFNGCYWHSTSYKDKFYHQRKLIKCKECGIRLFHVYEDEWNNNREEVEIAIKDCIEGRISSYRYAPLQEGYLLTEPNLIKIDRKGRRTNTDKDCVMRYYDAGDFIKNE